MNEKFYKKKWMIINLIYIATSLMSQEKISQILLNSQVFDDDMKIVVGSLDFLNIKGTLSKWISSISSLEVEL